MLTRLVAVPLTREGFAPFGDVIETDMTRQVNINNGSTVRFDGLARVDLGDRNGHALINIFRTQPQEMPMGDRDDGKTPDRVAGLHAARPFAFLVVVAAAGEIVGPDDLHAFITDGRQGINLARGTWHHPVIALDRETDFIVVDRGGPGDNLVEYHFDAEQTRQVGLALR